MAQHENMKDNFFYLEKVQNILMLGSEIIEKNSKKQWRNMILSYLW